MRTKKSLKNIVSMLVFNIILGILGFIKVKIFVKGLSNDIYSLNQLFYQIFSYIAITDIGFGLLLNTALYNAFAKDDKEKINEIYSTSKKFYNIIGTIMFGFAIILSFFIKFLTKAEVSPFYMQLMFLIFIIRNVVDYYFIAPRFVLEADQKLYKINHYIKLAKISEIIVEIILVSLNIDFLLVLVPGIIITILIDLYVNRKVYSYYPWLKDNHTLNKSYLKGTKDVVWRKLSGLLNSNTDIILISTFISPVAVIIYTSYTYITKFITDTIYMICNAIVPSYANVVIKEDRKKGYYIFCEINTLFQFVASFVFIMLYAFLNSLIRLWVGNDYVISNLGLFLFCFIAFQSISERATIMSINAKGLFKETKWPTILESILNLAISLLLVHSFGIIGVLLGTIISKILTTFIFYPIQVTKKIFNEHAYRYFIQYLINVAICIIFVLVFNIIKISVNNFFDWLVGVIIAAFIVFGILFVLNFLLFKAFRYSTARAREFIKVKGKYLE